MKHWAQEAQNKSFIWLVLAARGQSYSQALLLTHWVASRTIGPCGALLRQDEKENKQREEVNVTNEMSVL